MTRTLPIVLAVAVSLVVVASAAAHTLGVAGAKRAAYRDAAKRAEAFTRLERPTIVVHSCRRRGHHTVDCRVRYRFSTLTCRHVTRVRFSDTARRTRTRIVGEVTCR